MRICGRQGLRPSLAFGPPRAPAVKVLFFANTDWYLYNFRLAFAKFLRERGCEVVMLSPPGPYSAMLEAEGFRWTGLDMNRRSLNPLRELALLRRISEFYAAERPDIVHHFTIKCVVYGSVVARWRRIRNRVNAVTGLGYVFSANSYQARLLRPMVRLLLKAALSGAHTRLIVQNEDDLTAFLDAGLSTSSRTRLILGSGVDTSRFQPRSIEQSGSPLRVLLAARLLWDKGIREYVEAAGRSAAQGLPVEFLLAGTPDHGNPGSVAEDEVKRWEAAGVIRYLGHVTDMPGLLSEIDIAVLPSYREGVPRSLLEAAACGLPIIATDAPGCREIVRHGVNGLLVPPRDASALAEAIHFLSERPDERRRMGLEGRAMVIDRFDQRIVFDETFAVYQDLLSAGV